MPNIEITQKKLKQHVSYNKSTGIFFWKLAKPRGRRIIGDIAGYNRNGYIVFTIESVDYYAHRLAWLYEYGYLPENNIRPQRSNPSS